MFAMVPPCCNRGAGTDAYGAGFFRRHRGGKTYYSPIAKSVNLSIDSCIKGIAREKMRDDGATGRADPAAPPR
jgi:hypothetical protein